jgi:hypothetical protein
VGFRHPAFLWLLTLALPLILLYILKVRRQPRSVSSVMLWREALSEVEAQVPFRRLRRDWLLLLQLLILALAALAAAGPYVRADLRLGDRVGIVIDASASMLAKERIDAARREASGIVRGSDSADQFLVVRAGVRPRVAVPLTADRAAIAAGLDGLEASPAPADLDESVRLARSILGDEGSVVLITDTGGAVPQAADLTVLRVGEPTGNSSVGSLGVRRSDPSGLAHEVFVKLRNASDEPVDGTLELLVDGELRDASAVSIAAQGEASRTLKLVGVAEGVIEARFGAARPDALAIDDAATWVLRPPRDRRYRIVGPAGPYLRHALGAVERWREATPGQPADLEIVVRSAPLEDGPPLLWIDPPELRTGEVPGATVLTWERTHPLLRFVNLHSLRLGRIPTIARPPGARVLAESSAGPLMLEGSRGDRRCVIWAFDPQQTTLPLSVSFPLLTHNALEHLVPFDWSLPGGLRTGEAPEVPWPDAATVRLTAPSGKTTEVGVGGGVLRLPPLEEVGVFELDDGERRLRFATALLDEAESELRRGAVVPAPGSARESPAVAASAAEKGDARSETGPRDLWRLLALCMVGLLLFEGLAFHRRWSP